MSTNYPLIVALLSGIACYSYMRARYWRKRALHLEESIATARRIREDYAKRMRGEHA